MPLVYAGTREEEPITEAHERARKVRPQYAHGDLLRVTGARSLADGEMIQSILLDNGIPSMLRRTRGFDVPDFLAGRPSRRAGARVGLRGGPRPARRERPALGRGAAGALPGVGSPARLALGLIAAVGVAAVVVYLFYLAFG